MISIKKKRILRSVLGFVCAVTIASANTSVYAAPSTEDLENKTSNLQGELNNLNSELATLSKELDETSSQIETLAAEIEMAKLDLAAAKLNESSQYDAMKERIKFMYEGGTVSLLHILFSSKSMADFLNNAEYISMINAYDRNMLAQFQAAREEVENKEASLESQQAELTTLQATLTSNRDALNSKISSTSSALADYSAQLERAKAAEAALLAAQDKEKSAPITANADDSENVAQNTSASSGSAGASTSSGNSSGSGNSNASGNSGSSNTSGGGGAVNTGASVSASTSDVALMAAILQAEAGGSSYDGMLAVGTVIMNRVESSKYPNSLNGVIYQRGQFSPTWNGSLNRILANGPTSTAYSVAQAVLSGSRHSSVLNCYQFRASYTGRSGTTIGGNVFF